VGLTPRSFTPATERLVCLAGTLSDGFEEAATKVLPELAALKVAETTVQRTTEAAGQRVAEHLRSGGTFRVSASLGLVQGRARPHLCLCGHRPDRRASAGQKRRQSGRAHAVRGDDL